MMKTIEVHIDKHFEEFVQKMIETGEYADASEVVSDALTLLEEEEKLNDVCFTLTPKTCLEIALTDTGISDVEMFVEDERNRKFYSAYTALERRMSGAGYITDKNGETHCDKDSMKPLNIFKRTIRGFYPNTTDEQVDAAWDLFVYHMERQGNLAKQNQTALSASSNIFLPLRIRGG